MNRHCAPVLGFVILVVALPRVSAQVCPHGLGKLQSTDFATKDHFGAGLALDGAMLLVGAPDEDDNGSAAGAVYVFDANTSQELSKQLASDGGSGDQFGSAVALSGSIAAASAPGDDDVAMDSGAVYLFDPTTGDELAKLKASDAGLSDVFAGAVAMSSTTLVVGASRADGHGPVSGAVYVFDPSTHQELQKLTPPDGEFMDSFGLSVAVFGTTALIGAPFDDDDGDDSGSAYLFDTTSGTMLFKLRADDGAAGNYFGLRVAIHGSHALIGAQFDDENGDNAGAAYVFDVGTGQQVQKLLAGDGAPGDLLGNSVGLSGEVAIVGAPSDDDGGNFSGSAYLFDAATGQELAKLVADDADMDDRFGASITASGTFFAVGAPDDDAAAFFTDTGSAYLYRTDSVPVVYCVAKPNSLGCPTTIGSSGSASLTDPLPYDVFATSVISGRNGLLFYSLGGRATVPFFGGTLCVFPQIRRTAIQGSGGGPPGSGCTGSYSFDFNAWAQSDQDPSLGLFQRVNAQYWWRDPAHPDGTGVGLTNAIEFVLCQ